MRNFKVLMTILSMFVVIGATSAQSEGADKKAAKKVTELNEQLVAIDASLALTDDQVEQAHETFKTGIKEMNQVRKSAESKDAGKEATKPIRRKMNKKIRKEILTKEQRKALNANKKKD